MQASSVYLSVGGGTAWMTDTGFHDRMRAFNGLGCATHPDDRTVRVRQSDPSVIVDATIPLTITVIGVPL